MIFSKAGYSGWLALLMLIPVVNLIWLLIFAFSEWPIEAELARLGGRSPPERPDRGHMVGGRDSVFFPARPIPIEEIEKHASDPSVDEMFSQAVKLDQRGDWEKAFAGLLVALRCPLHAQSPCFVELTEVGHGALSGAAISADRFDERPIGVPLAVLHSVTWANEYVQILSTDRASETPNVYTTSRFNFRRAKDNPLGEKPGKLQTPSDPLMSQNILEKRSLGQGWRTRTKLSNRLSGLLESQQTLTPLSNLDRT